MTGLFTLVIPLFLAVGGVVTGQQPPVAPQPVMAPAFAKHGKKFYVYGGWTGLSNNNTAPLGQFFALDLSKPWTSTAPVWIQLPSGPSRNAASGAISTDGKIFMTLPEKGLNAHRFSFETSTWTPSKAIFRDTIDDVIPVTIGGNGAVLIAGGKVSVAQESVIGQYDLYSFDSDLTMTAALPKGEQSNALFMMGRQGYGVVWSSLLKSAVYFGGFYEVIGANSASFVSTYLVTYNPELRKWTESPTSGWDKQVASHCMAITDDGKKVIVHGGEYDAVNTTDPSSDLYSLDLETRVWTKLASSGAPRMESACTIAGDHFLIWGGASARRSNAIIDAGKPSTPVLIYQISLNVWVTEYKPSADYLDPVPSPTPSTGPGSGSGSPSSNRPPGSSGPSTRDPAASNSKPNIAIIAGGIAGGLALIALIGLLVWRRKKRGARHTHQNDNTLSGIDRRILSKAAEAGQHNMRQAPTQTANIHPPHRAHGSGDVDDDTVHEELNGRTVDVNMAKSTTRPSAPGPRYPGLGANLNNSYAADGSPYRYMNADVASTQPTSTYSPSSPATSYDVLMLHSPTSSHSDPRQTRDAHSQEQWHMMLERPYAPDGRWTERDQRQPR